MRKSKQVRQEEMIRVTAELLLKQGFRATTTRHVTERLGVGTGLLNHYFTWTELRARAFESIATEDVTRTFANRPGAPARRVLRRFAREAFSSSAPPYWRLWIEAMEESRNDEQLSEVLRRHATQYRDNLTAVLTQGDDAREWSCADPAGSAVRILAAHDGLLGFVLTGAPPVTRAEAARHFRAVIANECPAP